MLTIVNDPLATHFSILLLQAQEKKLLKCFHLFVLSLYSWCNRILYILSELLNVEMSEQYTQTHLIIKYNLSMSLE